MNKLLYNFDEEYTSWKLHTPTSKRYFSFIRGVWNISNSKENNLFLILQYT